MEQLWCASITHFGASEEGVRVVEAVKISGREPLEVYRVDELDCEMLLGSHLFRTREAAIEGFYEQLEANINSSKYGPE